MGLSGILQAPLDWSQRMVSKLAQLTCRDCNRLVGLWGGSSPMCRPNRAQQSKGVVWLRNVRLSVFVPHSHRGEDGYANLHLDLSELQI
jgi:hypothetical protein